MSKSVLKENLAGSAGLPSDSVAIDDAPKTPPRPATFGDEVLLNEHVRSSGLNNCADKVGGLIPPVPIRKFKVNLHQFVKTAISNFLSAFFRRRWRMCLF
jgi:hypothetical protein